MQHFAEVPVGVFGQHCGLIHCEELLDLALQHSSQWIVVRSVFTGV